MSATQLPILKNGVKGAVNDEPCVIDKDAFVPCKILSINCTPVPER